jgi:hypothetical protein
MALNNVDFPTFGRPTIPAVKATSTTPLHFEQSIV